MVFEFDIAMTTLKRENLETVKLYHFFSIQMS